jgi:tryptophan synthase beta subunit
MGKLPNHIPISAGLDYTRVLGLCTANLYATGRAQFISITDEQSDAVGTKNFLKWKESFQQLKLLPTFCRSGRNEIQNQRIL